MSRKKAKALPPKMITVYAEILQETEDAILVRCDDEADGVWLPKSQIEYAGERGDTRVEITIPEWLATEKGFFDGMGSAPAQAPATTAKPAHVPEQPETVTITGSVMNYRDVEKGEAKEIILSIGREDEAGVYSESEYRIPITHVLSKQLNEDDVDTITVTHAYALKHGMIPPIEETADSQAGNIPLPDGVKWLKEESITVSQQLSESEKARYAEEMAALDKEIQELEDERAAVSSRLKKQIDAKEQERREMSEHVYGGEERTFSCDCLKDYNTGEMVWTLAYPPYDEVLRRKMTKEEMQPTLLEFESKQITSSAPAEKDKEPAEEAFDYEEDIDFDDMTEDDPDASEPGDEQDLKQCCDSCVHLDADDEGKACESCNDDLSNFTPHDAAEPQDQGASAGAAQ